MKAKLLPIAQQNTDIQNLVDTDIAWNHVTKNKKQATQKWVPLLKALLLKSEQTKTSVSGCVDWFLSVYENPLYADMQQMALGLGRKGKAPSRASLISKCVAYKNKGIMGIIPKHKGKKRTVGGWEVSALKYWQKPSKPSYQAVAEWLQDDGYNNASYTRVRSYLMSLPSDMTLRGRIGERLYQNTHASYVRRTTQGLAPGAVYQGDGNKLDVYLRHPSGKKVWRAELTLWIDVASRYVVGWYISEAESANSTLFALSHALLSQDHIPAMLHIDNGSGYKNKMLSDCSNGFYDRLGIEIMHAIPYNAKGKGQVERFFGTMQRKFLKRYDSYCGKDMDKEAAQKVFKSAQNGAMDLPTLEDFKTDFSHWIENTYHQTPHRSLDKKTPAEVYARRERFPIKDESEAIFWPRTTRTIRREAIHFDNREYSNPSLTHYNTKQVIVEYNLHDDTLIRVLDEQERWICDAKLIQKQLYIPRSRIKQAKQKRLNAQINRLEKHALEKKNRAGLVHQHTDVTGNVLYQQTSDAVEHNTQKSHKEPKTITVNIEDIF